MDKIIPSSGPQPGDAITIVAEIISVPHTGAAR